MTARALRLHAPLALPALAAALTAIGALSACGGPSSSVDNAAGGGPDKASALIMGNAENRESYALGYQVATNLTQQGTSINPEALQAGIADQLAGAPSRIGERNTLDTLNAYQQRTQQQHAAPAPRRTSKRRNGT